MQSTFRKGLRAVANGDRAGWLGARGSAVLRTGYRAPRQGCKRRGEASNYCRSDPSTLHYLVVYSPLLLRTGELGRTREPGGAFAPWFAPQIVRQHMFIVEYHSLLLRAWILLSAVTF